MFATPEGDGVFGGGLAVSMGYSPFLAMLGLDERNYISLGPCKDRIHLHVMSSMGIGKSGDELNWLETQAS